MKSEEEAHYLASYIVSYITGLLYVDIDALMLYLHKT